jgi:hypothetical protein
MILVIIVVVPASPVHFTIEVSHRNIKVFNIRPHNLAWGDIPVAQVLT